MSNGPIASEIIVTYYCHNINMDTTAIVESVEKQMIPDSPFVEYPNCCQLIATVFCECGKFHNVELT